MSKLKQFVTEVEEQESLSEVTVSNEAAVATKDYVKSRLEAAVKGGRVSRKNVRLKSDPKSVSHRERMRKYRAKKNKEKRNGG